MGWKEYNKMDEKLKFIARHLARISHKLPTAVYSFAPIQPPTP